MLIRRVPVAGALLVAVLALAACGGGDGGSTGGVLDQSQVQGASSSVALEGVAAAATTAATQQSFQDAALAFAKCLRGEGLDVKDPDFSSGGGGPGNGLLQGLSRDDPKVQAALEKCRPLMDAARPQLTEEQQAQRRDELLALAKCLRGKGLDVKDPDFSSDGGPGAGGGFFGTGIDPRDEKVRTAIDACRDELGLTGPGGPGGAPGAGGPPPA